MVKNALLSILFLMVFNIGFSQTTCSSDLMDMFQMDSEKKEWIKISESKVFYSFFEFNKDYSMLVHCTANGKDSYSLKEGQYNPNNENELYWNARSNEGDECFIFFDMEKEIIRINYYHKDENNQKVLNSARFRIKKTWKD